MTQLTVKPRSLKGVIHIPPSKSQTLRAILFASLAKGNSVINDPLKSPDAQCMICACRQFGASIDEREGELFITGNGGVMTFHEGSVDCGNSGIVLRFCAAIAALGGAPVSFRGDDSLCRRPMHALGQALDSLGVHVDYQKKPGFAPLTITGPITGEAVTLDGSDSQPVSALLIVAALFAEDFEMIVTNPGEKPWVEMTLAWLRKLGVEVLCENYERYRIQGKGWDGFSYTVPGDWSSAAFPIAAALVTRSELTVTGLFPDFHQGDQKIMAILESMGARFAWTENSLTVLPFDELKGIDIDLNDCIDALPILAVIACAAKGTTRLYNAAVAKTKECDRISCMARELGKMGARIKEFDDGLLIEGGPLHGAGVESHGDHRMAMALAVAALAAQSETTIHNIACIAKTYPNFFLL